MTAFPKIAYVRSKKLMEAYRAIPCQNFQFIRETRIINEPSRLCERGIAYSRKHSD